MFLTVSRSTVRPAVRRLITRYKSSAPPGPRKMPDPPGLPPERMRALIALYHQADSFITRENLSRRIDEAFLGLETNPPFVGLQTLSPEELKKRVGTRRVEPLIGMREDVNTWRTVGKTWSSHVSPRALAVQAALYGTYEGGRELPGLETLEEEWPIMERQLELLEQEDSNLSVVLSFF
jgi:hypothetical protein